MITDGKNDVVTVGALCLFNGKIMPPWLKPSFSLNCALWEVTKDMLVAQLEFTSFSFQIKAEAKHVLPRQ